MGLAVTFPTSNSAQSFGMEDYSRVEKIDIHVHFRTDNTEFAEMARTDRFRFMNIAVHSADNEEMEERHRAAYVQHLAHPQRVAMSSSFPMAGWDKPQWQQDTIRYLDDTFSKGAVGVKVWKNIGMEFRDREGRLIMIDHPRFNPVFEHLQQKGIPLIGHLGEPKNCWLPLDQMTVKNDRNYFRNHPEYHMFLHPEMPSYEEQIQVRDQMLEKNQDLRFMGAHFASLEWSVDELGKFFDRFPNAVADTAARMGQLQYQSNSHRSKVRDFMIKYQDRLLYGTDLTMTQGTDPNTFYRRAHTKWLSDWKYLNTEESMAVPELDAPVRGISLPKEVAEKIYRLNAHRLFPKSWKKE